LDQAPVDLNQGKPLAAVDVNPSGEKLPQFLHSKFAQGIFRINCTNESSKVSDVDNKWTWGAAGECGAGCG
jgi:hypothetical protein